MVWGLVYFGSLPMLLYLHNNEDVLHDALSFQVGILTVLKIGVTLVAGLP
jgi:hypothetical protein